MVLGESHNNRAGENRYSFVIREQISSLLLAFDTTCPVFASIFFRLRNGILDGNLRHESRVDEPTCALNVENDRHRSIYV